MTYAENSAQPVLAVTTQSICIGVRDLGVVFFVLGEHGFYLTHLYIHLKPTPLSGLEQRFSLHFFSVIALG